MSDDRQHNNPQPPDRDANRVLAILARLPRSTAPVSARENARMAFLNGSVVKGLDQTDSGEQGKSQQTEPPTHGTSSSVRRWVSVLLAAALGVVAVFWFGSQPQQDWVVKNIQTPEGISIPGDAVLSVGTHLESGFLTTGPESELVIQLGDKLRLTLLPGTSLSLPKPPGRWFGRSRRMHIDSGETYGTSGGQKLGFELVFSTDELEARLTGTTFAVFRIDVASCVCLWEGGVAVSPLVGDYGVVHLEEKHRVWIYRDGREPEIKGLDANETMKLQMTDDAGLADLPDDPE
ncbi:MAG: FecR domain-containing protein [bacterium]|nr:FecR domain-containing protein [bacterium]